MKKNRILRLEHLENRTLLSLNPGTLDWQTLDNQECFASTNNPIYVTTLHDISDETDGLISLREAIDYAGASVNQETLGNTIKFDCFGKIQLNGTALSITKNLTIDASEVSEITIDAQQNSRLFYLRSSSTTGISVSLNNLHLINGSPGNGETAKNNGGAVYNGSLSRLTLSGCELSNNHAISGGAIYNLGTLTLSNSSILSNQANQGGGLYNASAGIMTISGAVFQNNVANSYAGGILNAGTVLLSDSVIASNQAISTDGGGIYNIYSGFLTINSSTIQNNSAYNNGGGLYHSAGNGSLIISNSLIANNEATTGSGGAFYNAQQGKATISDSSFQNNIAFLNGGAISNLESGSLDLIQTVISDNQAQTGSGGGIENDVESSIVLVDVDLLNNQAAFYGGGINNSGNLAAVSSTVQQNQAGVQGGGIRNSGIVYWSNGSIESNHIAIEGIGAGGGIFNLGQISLYNSLIGYNYIEAERGTGGGICNTSGVLTINNSFFIQNEIDSTSGIGGGIFNSNGATADISASSFLGNKVSAEGGAFYSLGVLTLSNSSVSYNVDINGEGVFYDDSYSGSSYVVTRSTISDNIAYQSDAPFQSESELVLTDNALLVNSDVSLGIFSSSALSNFSKSLVLTNINSETVQLSSLSMIGNAAGLFDIKLYRKDGSVINDAVFQMNPDESITIELTSKSTGSALIQGANLFRLSWNVQTVLEDESVSDEIRVKTIDFEAILTENKATLTTEGNISVSLDGNSNNYSIKLNAQPTSIVFVYFQTDLGITTSKSLISFDSTNWNVAQTISVMPNIEELIQNPNTNQILLRHEIITGDVQYLGTTIDSVSIDVQDYIIVQNGCSLDLSDSFPGALWDLDNSGEYSALDWVSSNELNNNNESSAIFSVMKKEGDQTEEVPVKIENVAPTFDVQLQESMNGSLIELNLEAIWDHSSAINRWQIKWGDGSSQIISQSSPELRICHFYTQDGLFDISVEIVDSNEIGSNQFYHIASHEIVSTDSIVAALTNNDSNQTLDNRQCQTESSEGSENIDSVLADGSLTTFESDIYSDININDVNTETNDVSKLDFSIDPVLSLNQSALIVEPFILSDSLFNINLFDITNETIPTKESNVNQLFETHSATSYLIQNLNVYEKDLFWASELLEEFNPLTDSSRISESVAEQLFQTELEVAWADYDPNIER